MITYPDFSAFPNDEICSYFATVFVEENKNLNIFLYPGLKEAGAFRFVEDEMQEYCFVKMEIDRLCDVAWNNTEYVKNRDYSKEETEVEFKNREAVEETMWKIIKNNVTRHVKSELEKIDNNQSIVNNFTFM